MSNVASIDVDVQGGQITAANGTTSMMETKVQEAQCTTPITQQEGVGELKKLLNGEGGGSEVGASIAVDGTVAQTYMLVQKCCDDVDCSEGSPAWPGDCSLKFDCGSIFCESFICRFLLSQ